MGILYIVATPIGNLKDVTLRAIETLKEVDYILCEDTRVAAKLLSYYGVQKPLISFNEINEERKIPQVISDLLLGKKIALTSDAGTPLISDPGFKLVRESARNNLKIESIPGPSAAIAALTVSGLPTDKFLFLGYLPKKLNKRKDILKKLTIILDSIKVTVVIYESPYRLLDTLEGIKEIFGDIQIVIGRELTKLYEEVRREKVSEAIGHFQEVKPRGEFTILF